MTQWSYGLCLTLRCKAGFTIAKVEEVRGCQRSDAYQISDLLFYQLSQQRVLFFFVRL